MVLSRVGEKPTPKRMVLSRVGGNRSKNSSGERGFEKKRVVFKSCWRKPTPKRMVLSRVGGTSKK